MSAADDLFEVAGLTYAARGWLVFPWRPGRKELITKNGLHDATTDPEQIRRWWGETPNANVAIATGHTSGFWALDVDEHGKDGNSTLDGLERDHGALPVTVQQLTPTGGRHLLLRMNGVDVRNSAEKLGRSLD